MLPGEADAAVHLDAVLGAVLRRDRGQRGGDGRGELEGAVFLASRASSMARAASHTAAVARSVSAIISAHLCLMAWNWPIGRPNCSRIFAYSEAVSVAQRATPMHSADSSVDISARASVRLRLDSTRSSPTSTALARTCATGRSGSTLATGSISSWSASSTTHSSPLSIATGSTSSEACAAAGTARTSPRMTRPSPCRVAVRPESMA